MDSTYESVLLLKKEVFLYNLPPRQSNRGYRAADWNLETPSWTGRLRIVAKGKILYIKLEDASSGQLYAQCPVEEFPGIAVEPVLDSSRYFAIRLMADTGRTIFVGIGFAERSDSFDFNVAIQDHFKHTKQEEEAERQTKETSSKPALDLGLKDGQRLRLNLNTKRAGDEVSVQKSPSRQMSNLKLGTNTLGVILPPPPPGGRARSNRKEFANVSGNVAANPLSNSQNIELDNSSNSTLLMDLFQSSSSSNKVVSAPTNDDLISDLVGF